MAKCEKGVVFFSTAQMRQCAKQHSDCDEDEASRDC